MKESMGPSFGRPKTEHELQSQIENFAEEKFNPVYPDGFSFANDKEFWERKNEGRTILKASSELSLIDNLDNPPEDISEKSKELIAKHKDLYLEFSKEQSIAKLKFQTECISRYNDEFKPIVEDLRLKLSKVKTGEDFEQFGEDYIKSGMEGHVFKVQTPSGIYAVKFFKQGIPKQQLEAMRRAKDIPNVSHLIAYSQKEDVIVMDFFDGENLNKVLREEKPPVTDDELRSVLGTCIDLYKIGVEIDVGGNNVLFDKEKGFFFIDYHTPNQAYSFKHAINSFSEAIAVRKNFAHTEEYEEEAMDIERRMIKILKTSFPEFYALHRKDFEKGSIESLKAKIKGLFK